MTSTLWFTTPSTNWFEALPLGNGRLGAKVFGDVDQERIALNLDDLWSGDGPRTPEFPDGPKVLAEVRRLLLIEGDRAEATEVSRALQGPRVDSFQPLADLEIVDLDAGHSVEDYRRALDLVRGVARISYRRGQTRFERELVVSEPDQVLQWTVRADNPGAVQLRIALPCQHPVQRSVIDSRTVAIAGHAPYHLTIEYRDEPDPVRYAPGRGVGFGVAVRAEATGGTIEADEEGLTIRDADSVVVTLAGNSTFEGWDRPPGRDPQLALRRAVATLTEADRLGAETVKERHTAAHSAIFNRVELDLPSSPEISALPTAERLAGVAAGGSDPDLAAQLFNFGRYLLMASSRPGGQAANLQGIWNEDLRPMWGSDYTTNINTQMNYWLAEATGLQECVQPLIDLVVELAEAGAHTARNIYGADGWVSHHNSDLWRVTWPVGDGSDDPVWALAPTCGTWLAAHLMDHYEFRPDRDFLEHTVYPVLAGAVEFALALMVEDPAGNLQIAPSTSPEHHYLTADGSRVSVDYTTTFDLTVIRELLSDFLRAADILAFESPLIDRARNAAGQLPPIPISTDGRIQEWSTDWQPDEPTHRHQSHLYGLYPGQEIDPVVTPELAAAARAAIAVRTQAGTPGGGWSHAWYVNLWARLQEPEKAGAIIDKFLSRMVTENLMYLSHRNIFQIDANLGMAAGIAEMLIQSHSEVIRLLPAVPPQWATGKANGLRARGGLTFDVDWVDGVLRSARVTAEFGGDFRVGLASNLDATLDLRLAAGETADISHRLGSLHLQGAGQREND